MERLDDKKKVKRREHNRKKMYEFFAEKNRFGRPKHKFVEETPAPELLRILRWFVDDDDAMSALSTYARSHKQAVREMDEADLSAVKDLFTTRAVLES